MVSFFSGFGVQQDRSLLVVGQQLLPQQQEEGAVPTEVTFSLTGTGAHAQTASGKLASSVETAVANTTTEQDIFRIRRMWNSSTLWVRRCGFVKANATLGEKAINFHVFVWRASLLARRRERQCKTNQQGAKHFSVMAAPIGIRRTCLHLF